jgi:hypothetical protein
MPCKNPSHFQGIADLAESGSGTAEDFAELYPLSAAGEIEAHPRDLYYGRNVIWAGDHGRMVKVRPGNIEHIWGNIFDADKLSAIVAGIQEAEDRITFVAPYGTVSYVTLQDVAESIQAFAHGDDDGMDEPLSTGDEELDKYIADPVQYAEDNEWQGEQLLREMRAAAKEAERSGWGDVGTLRFTVRDGNHRAFGALLAGEPYIYMIVEDNQMQDLKDPKYGRTKAAKAIKAALE